MSLDVYLIGKPILEKCTCECGHEHSKETHDYGYSANITHNLNKMAEEAGIYKALWRPEEVGISKAVQLIPFLKGGLALLHSDPARFEKFNATNGWGLYENFVQFVERYLEACEIYPDYDVRVSR